jgi:hypothetical protein
VEKEIGYKFNEKTQRFIKKKECLKKKIPEPEAEKAQTIAKVETNE